MKIIKIFTILMIFGGLQSPQTAFSQNSNHDSRAFRRGTATIIFSGIGGAILGLSTLPFYTKPEENVNNITLGAIVGIVAGAGYLLYNKSTPIPVDNKLDLMHFPIPNNLPPLIVLSFQF